MSRKHILFVHANNTELGGADYCLFRLVLSLDAGSFRKSVMLREDTAIANLYRESGIQVHVLPILRIRKPDNLIAFPAILLNFWISVFKIAKFLRHYSVDIVHSNDLLDFCSVVAARLSGRPSVQHVRLMAFGSPLVRRFVGSGLMCLNSHTICVSKAVQNWYFGNTRRSNRVSVLYDWVDFSASRQDSQPTDLRATLGLPRDAILIGSIGRLEPSKGHEVFVRAAARLLSINRSLHFIVCGPTVFGRGRENYQSQLQKLTRELSIEQNVHFLGERRGIKCIFDQLDVFAHCAIVPESFGMVIAEALACGCSVIAANCGGVPEQIVEGVNGLLHKPGDAGSLADGILQLLSNSRTSMERRFYAALAAEDLRKDTLSRLADIYLRAL